MKTKQFIRSAIAAGTLMAIAPQAMPATDVATLTLDGTVAAYAVLDFAGGLATATHAFAINAITGSGALTSAAPGLTIESNGGTENYVTVESGDATTGVLTCTTAGTCGTTTIVYTLSWNGAGGVTVPVSGAPLNIENTPLTGAAIANAPRTIDILIADADKAGKPVGNYGATVVFTLTAN